MTGTHERRETGPERDTPESILALADAMTALREVIMDVVVHDERLPFGRRYSPVQATGSLHAAEGALRRYADQSAELSRLRESCQLAQSSARVAERRAVEAEARLEEHRAALLSTETNGSKVYAAYLREETRAEAAERRAAEAEAERDRLKQTLALSEDHNADLRKEREREAGNADFFQKRAEAAEARVAALMEERERAREAAYLIGFQESGEGYNGEWPFEGLDPEADAHWVERRRAALAQPSAGEQP